MSNWNTFPIEYTYCQEVTLPAGKSSVVTHYNLNSALIKAISKLNADRLIIKKFGIDITPANYIKTYGEGDTIKYRILSYNGRFNESEMLNEDGAEKSFDQYCTLKDSVNKVASECNPITITYGEKPKLFKVTTSTIPSNNYNETEEIEFGDEIETSDFGNECFEYQYYHAFIELTREANEVTALPKTHIENASVQKLQSWGCKKEASKKEALLKESKEDSKVCGMKDRRSKANQRVSSVCSNPPVLDEDTTSGQEIKFRFNINVKAEILYSQNSSVIEK